VRGGRKLLKVKNDRLKNLRLVREPNHLQSTKGKNRMPNTSWVTTSDTDKASVAAARGRVTPSPKIFNLKDDGNNADGSFCEFKDNAEVVAAAGDSVSFLQRIGLVK